jgi:hypothetical protein
MRVADVARGRAMECVVLVWLLYGKCGGDTDRPGCPFSEVRKRLLNMLVVE